MFVAVLSLSVIMRSKSCSIVSCLPLSYQLICPAPPTMFASVMESGSVREIVPSFACCMA